MKTALRTKILVEGNPELATAFTERIERGHRVKVERPPAKSLALVKARDSASMALFYAGEILLTECTVTVNDTIGFGAVMGDDPDKAYELAVVDAAFRAELPETAEWIGQMLEEEESIRRKHLQEQAAVLRSKVDFGTLEGLHDKS
jgi:alpha-D-ribose 1-methylphosphonate 5-triphosphate synthase subunit PhnG